MIACEKMTHNMSMDFYDQITCHTFPPCADEDGNTVIAEFFNIPSGEYVAPGFWYDPTSSVPGQGIHWEPVNLIELLRLVEYVFV